MPTALNAAYTNASLVRADYLKQYAQPVQALEAASSYYAVDIGQGSADACEIVLNPGPTEYTEGLWITFKARGANSGPVTLDVNGLGPKPVRKDGNSELITFEIQPGQLVSVVYDGSAFQCLGLGHTHPVSDIQKVSVFSAVLGGTAFDNYQPGELLLGWGYATAKLSPPGQSSLALSRNPAYYGVLAWVPLSGIVGSFAPAQLNTNFAHRLMDDTTVWNVANDSFSKISTGRVIVMLSVSFKPGSGPYWSGVCSLVIDGATIASFTVYAAAHIEVTQKIFFCPALAVGSHNIAVHVRPDTGGSFIVNNDCFMSCTILELN